MTIERPVSERNPFGVGIIYNAMEILVSIINTIPEDEREDTPVAFPSDVICEILEMFFAYVDEAEDINIQDLMDSTNMELSSTVNLYDEEDDEPKIH